MSDRPELDLPIGDDLTDRFSRIVAFAIAFATLVAALVGFLQTSASETSNSTNRRAEQLGVDALATLVRSQQNAQVEYQTFALLQEQRAAAASAQINGLYLGEKPDAARLIAEQAAFEQAATQSGKLTRLAADSPDGPERDPAFPARFFARTELDAIRLTALQDAVNEEASGWSTQASVYTAILAVLAVTLYLFGLALTLGDARIRRGFAAIGLGLVVVASLWAAVTASTSPRAAPEEAAAAFAEGVVALAAAHDTAGYQQAEAHLSRAIELRPSFARAYQERAGAILAAGSPQRAGGLLSIASQDALARSTRDLRQARDLGLQNSTVLNNLGFHTVLHSFDDEPGLVDEAIAALRRAIELDPNAPVPHYNLGLALFVAGRLDEARAAYDEGVRRTIYVDVAQATRREDAYTEELVLAGALTDLETVIRRRPDLQAAAAELKSRLVGPVSRGDPAPAPPKQISVDGIELRIFAGQLVWLGKLAGYDPASDTLSQQWYYNDPDNLGWQVLPNVSGNRTPSENTDGRHFVGDPYLATAPVPACLPKGSYRVELYANGSLIGQAETTADFGDLTAFAARDVTVAVCHPPDWQRSEIDLPGLMHGYVSPDKSRGIYLVRFGVPSTPGVEPGTLSAAVLDVTVTGFDFALPAEARADASSPAEDGYFLGLQGGKWRYYDYDGGRVRAGSGVTADGAVIVALMYGPSDYFESPPAFVILDSLTQYASAPFF